MSAKVLGITTRKPMIKLIAALLLGFAFTGASAALTHSIASAAPASYSVKYVAGKGGSIKGTATQTVSSGSNASSVTATPSKGYHFVKWSDGSTSATRTDKKITKAATYTASFEIDSFSVRYSAGNGGSIKGTAKQTVDYKSDASTVTAIANTGFKFVSWSDGLKTAARTDTEITDDLSVTATFTELTYSLKYTAGANGTIKGNASQTVKYNGDATLITAVPNTGYKFVSWSDGIKTAARTDSDVKGAISVTANFEILTYNLKYSAGAGGTIKGKAEQTVNYNADGAAVTATPNTGYRFVSWSDGVKTAVRTDSDVKTNVSATANFEIITFTLKYTAGAGGTIKGKAEQTVNYNADGAAVTATPNTGYRFVSWSDGVKTAVRTDLDVKANVSVNATFELIGFSLKYTAGANGTLTGNATQTVGTGADGATVTAVPNTGYNFVAWSDGVKTAARTDKSVKANITVTANFAVQTFIVRFIAAGDHGTFTGGSASQTINYGGKTAAVTAVPDPGFQFTSWSDGTTKALHPEILNVKSALTLTATFTITAAERAAQAAATAAVVAYEKGTFADYQNAFDKIDLVKDVSVADALQARVDAASAKYAEAAVSLFEKGTIDDLKSANDYISLITDLTIQGAFQDRIQARLAVITSDLIAVFATTQDMADFDSAKIALDQLTVAYVHDALLADLDGALIQVIDGLVQQLVNHQNIDVIGLLGLVDLLSDNNTQHMYYTMIYSYLQPAPLP